MLIPISTYCGDIDTLWAGSKITDVTVFFDGAQITRHAALKIKKGKYLSIINQLPWEINPKSVQVNGITNAKILSVKQQISSLAESKKGKEETDTENKIKQQEQKIKEVKNKIAVFDLEEKLLLDNSHLGTDYTGAKMSEIKEAADYYRIRLNEIRQGKLNLISELEVADKVIRKKVSVG